MVLDSIRFTLFPELKEESDNKAYLESYIYEDNDVRPGMLIVPGGGYDHLSKIESYHVAEFFFNKGFQTFILKYSTAPLGGPHLGLKPLSEITRAVRLIRSMSDEFKLKDDKLAACGFSAGGHLIATLCTHPDFNDKAADLSDVNSRMPNTLEDPYDDISSMPDAIILGYPVITMTGPYIHESSVRQLLGTAPAKEDLDFMSAQLHVAPASPPAFIFSFTDDQSVPVQNSYMYAEACQKAKVPYALHIFSHGSHGMALSDGYEGRFASEETACWPQMAIDFVNMYL